MGEVVAGIEMPDGEPGAIRDAAASLRQASGGFEHVGGGVRAATAHVDAWEGISSLAFRLQASGVGASATAADNACATAAQALDVWAGDLADAKRDIGKMQETAAELERQKTSALDKLGAAVSRAASIAAAMPAAALGALTDGGAALNRLEGEAQAAASDVATYAGMADAAERRLDELRAKAQDRTEALDADGDRATTLVRIAHDGLPAVNGTRAGTVGGVPLTSHSEKTSVALTVVVVRIGKDDAYVKEELANGKWRVTRISGIEGGFEFDPIPGGGVQTTGKDVPVKAGRLGASPDVQAAFLAQHEDGEVFEFNSQAEADKFMEYRDQSTEFVYAAPIAYGYNEARRIHEKMMTPERRAAIEWADRQKPVETYSQNGRKVGGSASISMVGGGEVSVMDGLGEKTDTQTGTVTRYAKLSGDAAADFAPPGAQVGGKLNGEAIVAFSFDKQGEPTGMTINLSGSAQFAGGLGTEIPGHAGASANQTSADRVERVIHFDAVDPGNREMIERFYESGGTDPRALADIATKSFDDDARVDIRHYDVEGSGIKGNLDTKIIKLEGGHETVDSTLSSARHSTPDGDEYVTTR
jgi:hypothetical protein